MPKILPTDQKGMEVCHVFKTQTYNFKVNPETKKIEKDEKKIEYEIYTVNHSRNESGNEVFELTENWSYGSMEKLAEDIVLMGFEALNSVPDCSEKPYIIKFTIPEFVGEHEILSETEVTIRGELKYEDKMELKEEVQKYMTELAKKKASKQTK